MSNKYFYQDFLMEFPKDENDYPIVQLKYLDSKDDFFPLSVDYTLFDFDKVKRYISFQQLHDTLDKIKWDVVLDKCSKCDVLLLIDDIKITNDELIEMKNFYLKVYYFNLLKYNKNTYIYSLT